jgi:ATP-binding cassette, subfamily C, type I secretion system permease/ATPase
MRSPSIAEGAGLEAPSTLSPARARKMKTQANGDAKSELRGALGSCGTAFVGIGAFSGLINVLMLTSSLFMLEVYDRVLPSRSVPTLVALSVLTAILFIFQALLEITRGRLLVRTGNQLDGRLSPRVYDAVVRLRTKPGSDGQQPVRDLDTVRWFLSSVGPTALFDLPWIPLYLAICFAFHTLIGVTALCGALVLVALTLLTEFLSRHPVKAATAHAAARSRLAESSRRNAEVITAMGMSDRLLDRWLDLGRDYLAQQKRANDVTGGLGSVGRALRMALQSAVLGVGAYLVIHQEATAGIIIAGSILAGRALAPIDLAIANWKGFVAARQSWRRLDELFAAMPASATRLQLPPPTRVLAVETLSIAPPGAKSLVVHDVNFNLNAGSALGIVGPSASGKSSLVRAIVGVWPCARGCVRLDGATIGQWTPAALGRHVGYLPQDVELFEGTIAQNIARFEPDPPAAAVIAAAKAAGVHDLIVNLPAGYETQLGERGTALSAGQQQRIALARALYGEPFLVVLDEPNSNLDAEGEEALTQAILGVRARAGIVIIVAHRPSALAAVDRVLAMMPGGQQAFGPKEEVLARLVRREPTVPAPLKIVPRTNG